MIEAIFFDDVGVINDNKLRGPQWTNLVQEYFISRYGGTPEAWVEGNKLAMKRIIQKMDQIRSKGISIIPEDYHEIEDKEWIEDMFRYVELEIPDNPVCIARDAEAWIMPKIDSAYPGVIDVIKELSEEYTLFIASNCPQNHLQWFYEGMGILDFFKDIFGSDIVHAFKNTSYYFEQVAKVTRVTPEYSVMIDDKIEHLRNARDVGFHGIHSGLAGSEPGEFPYFTESSEIYDLISSIA